MESRFFLVKVEVDVGTAKKLFGGLVLDPEKTPFFGLYLSQEQTI